MSIYDSDEYKKRLLSNIKEYLNKFEKQLEDTGRVEFIAHNHDFLKEDLKQANIVKVVRRIVIIWGLIILLLSTFIIYKEIIIPLNINISLVNYICIVIGLIALIVGLISINIKNIKRIDRINVDPNYLTICLLNDKMQTESQNSKIYEYNLNEINLAMRRRRSTKHSTLRSHTFNIYITYKNKKVEYLLTFEHEEEFFTFALFLESIINNQNIKRFSDDELYERYNTRSYGLTFNRI